MLSSDGLIPLYCAAQFGHFKVVTTLLQHGADLDKALNIATKLENHKVLDNLHHCAKKNDGYDMDEVEIQSFHEEQQVSK